MDINKSQPAVPATSAPATTTSSGPPADEGAPKAESVTIAIARHCPPALRRQQWSLDDFELRKLMYNGAISMVYHALDKRTGITVALKLYKRHKLNEIERHQVAREIRLHVDLTHDAIITMYAAWKDRSYVYLALEWAPGGDVYTFLKSQKGRLSEDVAVPLILEPFMAGLAAIHAKGLIHRDIKPENILLNNSYQIKIADFGLSIDSRQEIANTRLGTIDYLAPEILDCPVKHHPMDHKDKPDTGYSNKVDCWSVGVLAYELLCGYPPFAAPTAQETLRLIRTKRVEYPEHLSPGALDFMHSALVRDPHARPSIQELLDHPWIARYARRAACDARTRRVPARSTMDGPLMRSATELNGAALQAKHTAMAAATTSAAGTPPAPTAPAAAHSAGGSPVSGPTSASVYTQATHTTNSHNGLLALPGMSGQAGGDMQGGGGGANGGAFGSIALPAAPGSPTQGGGPKSSSPKTSLLGRKFKFWSTQSGKTVPTSYSFGPSSPLQGSSAAAAAGAAAGSPKLSGPPASPAMQSAGSGAVPPVGITNTQLAVQSRQPSLPPLTVAPGASGNSIGSLTGMNGMVAGYGSTSPTSGAMARVEVRTPPAHSISSAGIPPARKYSGAEADASVPAVKQSLFNRLFSS